MPQAAATRCTYSGCGAKATTKSRCDEHQRAAWENKSANTQQLSRGQRMKFRREQLEREPHCRVCGTEEDLEADHITEIADGGDPLDASNGQTLCKVHHAEKTALAKRLRRARRQASGG